MVKVKHHCFNRKVLFQALVVFKCCVIKQDTSSALLPSTQLTIKWQYVMKGVGFRAVSATKKITLNEQN